MERVERKVWRCIVFTGNSLVGLRVMPKNLDARSRSCHIHMPLFATEMGGLLPENFRERKEMMIEGSQ